MQSIKELSESLLPLLGVIVLIGLILVIFELVKLLKTTNKTLEKTHNTIDLVDESLKKVQAPLDTGVKLAGTVDKAHDATVKAVDDAKEYVSKNAEVIKDKVVNIVNSVKKEATDEVKEPSPEDIL